MTSERYQRGFKKFEEIHGPVGRAELESLFTAGVVTVDTLVLQEGMYDWIHFVDLKKTTQILPVIGAKPTDDKAGSQ